MEENKTFEEKMDRLEQISEDIQNGDISIQQSVDMFEDGIKLIRELTAELSEAEVKVKQLLENKEVDFDVDE